MVCFFRDFLGNVIKLDDRVWFDHISHHHPEMTKEIIAQVLLSPSVLCESQHRVLSNTKQYYKGPWVGRVGKVRYHRVIVKECSDGNWISTAHTRAKWSCGKILFRDDL